MSVRLIGFLFIALVSCREADSHKSNSVIFHYNQPNYITSLDPAFAKSQNNIWAVDHIFNQLIDLDSTMKLVPELANFWEVSEDQMQYTFHLKRDVFFHKNICFGKDSTRRLVSKDIVFSFNRLVDTSLNPPGSWIFLGRVANNSPFLAPNDSTFILNLKEPFSPMLQILTMQYCSVIPKEAIDYYKSDFRKNPVGTGAFYFKKWLDRNGVFLSRNKQCFINLNSNLDGIRISFIEDRSIAYLEFLKGKLDFFSGLTSSFAGQVFEKNGELKSKVKDKFQVNKSSFLNTEYIGINLKKVAPDHILQNREFRVALNLGVNKEMLVKSMRNGIGTPAYSGFIPNGLPSFSDMSEAFPYDRDSAVKILNKIHYDFYNPKYSLKIHCNKDYIDLVTYVAREWQSLGIRVEIEQTETATLREMMKTGAIAMFRASWIADYSDEESFFNVFYSKNAAPPNYTRFSNQLFDELYEKAVKETDYQKRKLLFIQMNDIINYEAPIIPLFYDQSVWFSQNNILHLKADPMNLLKLDGVMKNIKN
jgi:peptide/nickel transport system substrate-binding protein